MKTKTLKSVMAALVVLFSFNAHAYDFEAAGIYYNIVSLSDLTCEVTTGSIRYQGDIRIPAYVSYNGRTIKVIGIAGYTFKDNLDITSVTFPETLEYIGEYAFQSVYQQSTVKIGTLPKNLKSIGTYAFYRCCFDNLYIPDSITSMDAFQGVTVTGTIYLPSYWEEH